MALDDETHYVDQRLADHHRLHETEHRALEAATLAQAARFESVNEFRGQLADQVGTFVTRDTLDVLMKAQDDRIRELSASSTRTAISAVGAAGIISFIGGFILAGGLG